MKIYLKYCKRCKKQQKHEVIAINRKRGIKLRCLRCGGVDPFWHKKAKELMMKKNDKTNAQKK